VVARDETGAEAAGEPPKDSTRISGKSFPVASLIFAFWASVSLIFTSCDILDTSLMPSPRGKRRANVPSGVAVDEVSSSQSFAKSPLPDERTAVESFFNHG
jgi:hypothetical protein